MISDSYDNGFHTALFCDCTTVLSEFIYHFRLFNRYIVTQSGIGAPRIVLNHHVVTTIKYLIQNPELDRCS